MALSNEYPDRGKIGPTPALTKREDESFLNYITDLRKVLMMAPAKTLHPKANAVIEAEKVKIEPTKESVEQVRDVIRRKIPEAGIWSRVYRSSQEALWRRVAESYDLREDEFLRMLEEYDQRGPGSVEWDPDYIYPNYTKVETHLQNGGYVQHPLAGLRFDYGTRVFHGNDTFAEDFLHAGMTEKISVPLDGKVGRIMDIACSIGSLTCSLKTRFPEAEVWGSDISAPMVRYTHYRAVEQGIDVNFIQKAGEDLDELPESVRRQSIWDSGG